MTTQQVTSLRKKYEERPVQRIKGNPGSYWVQSFNPKHKQLFYKVVLRPEQDVVTCTCKAFEFNPSNVCKHILRVVESETMVKEGR